MPDRAIVFVDGNNWYHALRDAGITGYLNYAKVSEKLVRHRQWIATYYYIGQVQQRGNSRLYADQRRYMSWLSARDPRIKVRYGRLETRRVKNEAARELKEYLAELGIRIDERVYRELVELANRHDNATVTVEKAVDVNLAIDVARMADNDDYDVAYILSADGDFTPAVEFARSKGKRVFAASIAPGAKLRDAVNQFIRLEGSWFDDCFGE